MLTKLLYHSSVGQSRENVMENKEDEIKQFIKAKAKIGFAQAKKNVQTFYSLLPISKQHPREAGFQCGSGRQTVNNQCSPFLLLFLGFVWINVTWSGVSLWSVWVTGLAVSPSGTLHTPSPWLGECWMLCQPCPAASTKSPLIVLFVFIPSQFSFLLALRKNAFWIS